MKTTNLHLALLIILCGLLISCSGKPSQENKQVIHLFNEAQSISGEGILPFWAKDEELRSRVTYPHHDTVWSVEHEGHQALRFESRSQGDLRGSIYLFRDIQSKEFTLTMKSWLDAENMESWSGLTFWMTHRINRTIGVRWKASGIRKQLQVQFFTYQTPELKSLKTVTLPFSASRWANIKLSVQDSQATLTIDEAEVLTMPLQEDWHLGNYFSLYQSYGTGYFSDIHVSSQQNEQSFDALIAQWNEEILHTTRKLLLNHFVTPDELSGLTIPVKRLQLADEWRTVVPVYSPSRLEIQTDIPNDAKLSTSFGILPPFALSNATATFSIKIKQQNEVHTLFTKTLNPRQDSIRAFRYHDVNLSLTPYSGKRRTLLFEITTDEGSEPLIACWSEPIIAQKKRPTQPNVLFVVLDTLRADRLGSYGYDKNLTPYLDQLASEGTVFLNTIAQAPWTAPSHASMFTSLYPSETGFDNPSTKRTVLQEAYRTMAESYQQNNYHTIAYTNGIQILGELGFNQGFDLYQEIIYDKAYSMETVYERFSDWLNVHEDEPWFAFLHTYAVHFPYKHQQYVDYRQLPRTWDDQKMIDIDTYDSGVRYVDEWVGSLLRDLKRRSLLDSTIIIITSDHGEDLGERGMPRPARHGYALYDEQVKVPLIIRYPKKVKRGQKITNQVRLLDLMPTMLDLMGWEKPVATHGLSLVDLLQGKPEDKKRVALSEGMTYGHAQCAFRTNEYKLHVLLKPLVRLDNTPTHIPVPMPDDYLLFNLLNDPGETINLATQNPQTMDEFLKKIIPYIEQSSYSPEFFTEGSSMREAPSVSPELRAEMVSGGYWAN